MCFFEFQLNQKQGALSALKPVLLRSFVVGLVHPHFVVLGLKFL